MFVDREDELSLLKRSVFAGDKVLLVGLRGYGKTSLAKKLYDDLLKEGIHGLFIDCLKIYSPEDLVILLGEETKGFGFNKIDAKNALEYLFSEGERRGFRFFIFDEFTTLFYRFGLLKPFRGMGGFRAVAQFFKSILDNVNASIIFLDTSFKDVYEAAKSYSSPLFRQFHIEIKLGPLPLNAAVELVVRNAEMLGITLKEEDARFIAELCHGVPYYIIRFMRILPRELNRNKIIQLFEFELTNGFLNDYFSLMFENFSPTEQEVLYIISRGWKRFQEIDMRARGAPQALDSLQKKGIIEKITKGKRLVYYDITDKVFKAWLAMNENPRYKKLSFERVYVSSLSFEALVREILFKINSQVSLEDFLGRKIFIGPYRSVEKFITATTEIDALARKDDTYDIFEIHFGAEMPSKKLDQVLRQVGILTKMGFKIENVYLVSYFGFNKQLIKAIRRLTNTNIYLLGRNQIKKLAKKASMNI